MSHSVETFVKNGTKFTTWKLGSTQYVTADFDDEKSAVAVQVVLESARYKCAVHPMEGHPGRFTMTGGREWWPDGKPAEVENGVTVVEVGDGRDAGLPDSAIELRPSGLSAVRRRTKK